MKNFIIKSISNTIERSRKKGYFFVIVILALIFLIILFSLAFISEIISLVITYLFLSKQKKLEECHEE
jgi:Ca2+/Na+ antiporter